MCFTALVHEQVPAWCEQLDYFYVVGPRYHFIQRKDSCAHHGCNCHRQKVQRHMSMRVPIGDGDTIHIVGVDVICESFEIISREVLVAPSLSSDLAVVNVVNRVCNTRTS